jgi:regulator of RNase E activity RraA
MDVHKLFDEATVPTVIALLVKRGLRTRHFVGLRPIDSGNARICGRAFTVRTIPVREDMRDAANSGRAPNLHRQAIAAAQPGDVILVDARDCRGVSPIGDIIALALKMRGIAGFVTDSGAGDIPGIVEVGLPVFCHGSAPVPGSTAISVVDWGLPIGCAGVAVYPGDLILGDATGAVCIPAGIAEEIAAEAVAQEALERFLVDRIKAGHPLETTYPPDAMTMAAYRASRGGR